MKDKTLAENSYFQTRIFLTHEATQKIIEVGVDYAQQKALHLSIAVVDPVGSLIAFQQMDKAKPVTIDVALGKVKTAAFLGAPSKKFEDMINDGKPSMLSTPGLTPLQGGEPIFCDGDICGAVGVSGASGEVDQGVAKFLATKILNLQ